jgi:hypothetical protein
VIQSRSHRRCARTRQTWTTLFGISHMRRQSREAARHRASIVGGTVAIPLTAPQLSSPSQ